MSLFWSRASALCAVGALFSTISPAEQIFQDGFEECGLHRWSAGPFDPVVERFSDVTPGELAQALEACVPSLLSAEFRLPDGAIPDAAQLTAMSDFQSAVMVQLGIGGFVPRSGPAFVALSSGHARDYLSPDYALPQPGTNLATAGLPPAALLAAHEGHLPAYPTCPWPGNVARDPVTLHLTLQAPPGAAHLAIDWLFLSANYAEWVCTNFDDYFLIMVDGTSPDLPVDRNLALDSAGNPMTSMNDDYFYCSPAAIWTCPGGTSALLETGYDGGAGGATAWHTARIPVVGGETLTVDLSVFDGGDHAQDTAVLVDGLRWLAD